jgi:hypothetical protein
MGAASSDMRPAQVARLHFARSPSLLISQGFSPKYVCDQLGHSSIQMTFDTYGHLFPRAREEASAKLEEAIRKGRKEAIPSGN